MTKKWRTCWRMFLLQQVSGLEFATDLQSPDFAKIAEGAGLLGLTASTPDR